MSNLNQFGTATSLYLKNHNNKLVRGALNDGKESFTMYELRAYLNLQEAPDYRRSHLADFFAASPIYRCPSFREEHLLTYLVNSTDFSKDYSSGRRLEELGGPKNGRQFVALAGLPSETGYITEISHTRVGKQDYYNYNIWKYSDLPWGRHGNTQTRGRMANTVSSDHPNVTNVLFLDSHVQQIDLKSSSSISPAFLTSKR